MVNWTGCNECLRKGVLLLMVCAHPIGETSVNDYEPIVRLPRGYMNVSEAIAIVERQTGFVFSYSGDSFDVNAKITFSDNVLTLRQLLDELITDEKTVCMVRHKYIIIYPKGTEGGFKEEKTCIPDMGAAVIAYELCDAPSVRNPERQEITAANEQANESLKPSFSSHTSPDFFPGNPSHLPVFAFKSNLLCAAGTLTPNLAVELGLGTRTSLVFSGAYRAWGKQVQPQPDKKHDVHWVIRPEFKYWLYERFDGHYLSGNVFHVQFNICGRNVPLAGFTKKYCYEGNASGVGVNWGYQLPLGDHWGVEFSAGLGVAYIYYERLETVNNRRVKWYKGPTHAAVNIVYRIN